MTEALFNDIINQYANAVQSLIRRMIGFQEAARDLAQDVFMKLWNNRHSVDTSRPVFTYLYKLAINSSIDYLRKIKPLSIGDEVNQILSVDQNENQAELFELIQKCLEFLKPKQKAVFILRDFDGLTFEEIAKVLDTNEQNVRSNLHLARRRVRELLEEKFEVNLEYINDL
jgi:RNA polymerase sigma-70 factor (ECF subfamily)